jgi:hypothetical protein
MSFPVRCQGGFHFTLTQGDAMLDREDAIA